jgi:dATP pyrophosphohydrolase
MTRAPFQVLVYPYRPAGEAEFEYALFKRADAGWWQGVAGGGEDNETPLEAARREAWEEAGIPSTAQFLPLDTISSVRVTEFGVSQHWGDHIFVIPQYCFGVLLATEPVTLSEEHTQYRWLPYPEADHLIRYDSNKTALWELNQRLKGRGPRD